jgi:hypothetical protein
MKWYEEVILGCPSERWLALRTVDDFYAWLEERESHQHSVVGVFTRFGRSIGLHKMGQGTSHLLSDHLALANAQRRGTAVLDHRSRAI